MPWRTWKLEQQRSSVYVLSRAAGPICNKCRLLDTIVLSIKERLNKAVLNRSVSQLQKANLR